MCDFFFIFLVCFFRNSTLINIIVSYICYLFVGSVLLIYMFTEHHSLYLAFSSVPGPIPKTCSLFCVLLLLLPPPLFVFFLGFAKLKRLCQHGSWLQCSSPSTGSNPAHSLAQRPTHPRLGSTISLKDVWSISRQLVKRTSWMTGLETKKQLK